jgi:hypothetical protein
MADRLSKLRVVDPVLSRLARGYSNNAAVMQFALPQVPVPKLTGIIPQFTKESFKIYETLRAPRATTTRRINPEDRTTLTFRLEEHELEYPIDWMEEHEDMFPLQQHAMLTVTEAMAVKQEKLAADLVFDATQYDASHVRTLSGTAQWNDAASKPIKDIKDMKETLRETIGRNPNSYVGIMGPKVFANLTEHASFLDVIKYTQTGIVTLELMKNKLELAQLHVGYMVYAEDDGTFKDVIGKDMWIGYVPQLDPQLRSPYNPSFGYTLMMEGWAPIDRYTEKNKVEIVRSTEVFKHVILGKEAGVLIKNAVA